MTRLDLFIVCDMIISKNGDAQYTYMRSTEQGGVASATESIIGNGGGTYLDDSLCAMASLLISAAHATITQNHCVRRPPR
jgi:hypothetical protein